MMQFEDMKKAQRRLVESGCTCAICFDDKMWESRERGVKPLLLWLEEERIPRGFFAADKVVGRAAAFLYVLLGARAVWADVISEPACEVLHEAGIHYEAAHIVPAIRNRTNTGFCPMETSVLGITDPQAALVAIKNKLRELSQQQKG